MTTMANRERMRDRARHIDLLDQVADSTEERDEVRRILSQPLSEAELDAQIAWKRAPLAVGRCTHAQGTCPTPQACELPEPEWPTLRARSLWRVVVLVLASWAAVAATLLAVGWKP